MFVWLLQDPNIHVVNAKDTENWHMGHCCHKTAKFGSFQICGLDFFVINSTQELED